MLSSPLVTVLSRTINIPVTAAMNGLQIYAQWIAVPLPLSGNPPPITSDCIAITLGKAGGS